MSTIKAGRGGASFVVGQVECCAHVVKAAKGEPK